MFSFPFCSFFNCNFFADIFNPFVMGQSNISSNATFVLKCCELLALKTHYKSKSQRQKP